MIVCGDTHVLVHAQHTHQTDYKLTPSNMKNWAVSASNLFSLHTVVLFLFCTSENTIKPFLHLIFCVCCANHLRYV